MYRPQVTTINIRRWTTRVEYFVVAFLLVNFCPIRAWAQDSHSHNQQDQEPAADQQSRQSALIKMVRDATARYQDVKAAEYDGYRLEFGCVSGDDFGAMGLHYVNDTLVGNGVIDPAHPQIILYEAQPNGKPKLTGADYLVMADAWDATHPGVTPQLMGQIFHYFSSPNRFGLPAFYTLHVWAWKENPVGTFSNWNPNVSCDAFNTR